MRNHALEYFHRLISRFLTYLTGGFIGAIIYGLDYLVPAVEVPNWFFFAVLPLLSFLYANYSIFCENKAGEAELLVEIQKWKQEFQDLQDTRPKLEVSLLEGSAPVKKIQRILKPIPPEPDYDRLLESERKRIHDKLRRGPFPTRRKNPWLPNHINKPIDYTEAIQDEVTEYINDYRHYLEHDYLNIIFQDRHLRLQPLIENKGSGESSNVRIDFIVPLDYGKTPADKDWMEIEAYGISKAKKPAEPTIESINKKHSSYKSEMGFNFSPPDYPYTADNNWAAGNSRRTIDRLESETRISYFFNCLVPGQSEKDLDPFPLWLGNVEGNEKVEIKVVIIGSNIIDGPKEDKLEIEFIVQPANEGSEAKAETNPSAV